MGKKKSVLFDPIERQDLNRVAMGGVKKDMMMCV